MEELEHFTSPFAKNHFRIQFKSIRQYYCFYPNHGRTCRVIQAATLTIVVPVITPFEVKSRIFDLGLIIVLRMLGAAIPLATWFAFSWHIMNSPKTSLSVSRDSGRMHDKFTQLLAGYMESIYVNGGIY